MSSPSVLMMVTVGPVMLIKGAQESVSLLQPHLTNPGIALLGLGTGSENPSDYFLKHAIKKRIIMLSIMTGQNIWPF